MRKNGRYIEHSAVECHGVDIVDSSGSDPSRGNSIWVGVGEHGRWMTSSEVRELAAALFLMADSHDARLADDDTMPDYLAAMDRPNS